MIKHTRIIDIKDQAGKTVPVTGFVQTLRVQSKIIFMIVRDITGTLQVIVEFSSEFFAQVRDLSLESVVLVEGEIVEAKQAPGGYEMKLTNLTVLSAAEPELPIPVVLKAGEDTEAPTRFDYRWLDLRKADKAKIFKVWTAMEKGFRNYWNENNYMQIYTPSFMNTPSESGAEVFQVEYFDRKAYLAQSPQFYKQMAIASGFERVFIAGPVFRAEASFTSRHLTEFTGWDFELAYVESHHDIMDEEEGMIVAGFEQLKKEFPEMDITIPARPFPRFKMVEAKQILADQGVTSDEEHDLSPEEERAICEHVKNTLNHEFVFITDYHKSKSAFYHMRTEEGSDRSRRADLLFRGIEVTTLAQREHRPEILKKQAAEKYMNLEPLTDYVNFFRFGCPPHGGAGIGPARFIMKLLDLSNVREATYLPRDVKRLNP